MNNQTLKHKYVPCQVKIIEFNVERGFATSGEGLVGAFANAANNKWIMQKDGTSSNFRNMESYGSDGNTIDYNWGE